jgi:Sugar-transfer associated ATP-grasp
VLGQEEVWDHPSTNAPLIGAALPFWRETVEAARRCSDALGLGYVGVDLVIDATRGVQVLECNAYPGLEIQNINGAGLGGRIALVQSQQRERERTMRRDEQRRHDNAANPLRELGMVLRQGLRDASGRLAGTLNEPVPLAA